MITDSTIPLSICMLRPVTLIYIPVYLAEDAQQIVDDQHYDIL